MLALQLLKGPLVRFFYRVSSISSLINRDLFHLAGNQQIASLWLEICVHTHQCGQYPATDQHRPSSKWTTNAMKIIQCINTITCLNNTLLVCLVPWQMSHAYQPVELYKATALLHINTKRPACCRHLDWVSWASLSQKNRLICGESIIKLA